MSDELKAALNKLEWAAVSAEAAASHAAEFPNGVAEQVKEASAERLASARARVEALCVVPDGWRLVPAEPTGEMVKAGIAANDGIVSDIYRAMLAAAPPPPGTAPVERPAEWRGPSERWSTGDRVDIELGDGSILRDCIPQADGDLWWSGAGIGERFIDPECAAIERWRITPEELRND